MADPTTRLSDTEFRQSLRDNLSKLLGEPITPELLSRVKALIEQEIELLHSQGYLYMEFPHYKVYVDPHKKEVIVIERI